MQCSRSNSALHEAWRIAALNWNRGSVVRVVLAVVPARGVGKIELQQKTGSDIRGIDGTDEQLHYIPAKHEGGDDA